MVLVDLQETFLLDRRNVFFFERTKKITRQYIRRKEYFSHNIINQTDLCQEKREKTKKKQGKGKRLLRRLNATLISRKAAEPHYPSKKTPKVATRANDHIWLSKRMDSRITETEESTESKTLEFRSFHNCQ